MYISSIYSALNWSDLFIISISWDFDEYKNYSLFMIYDKYINKIDNKLKCIFSSIYSALNWSDLFIISISWDFDKHKNYSLFLYDDIW